MNRNEKLLERFMSCEHVKEAKDLTETCLNTQAFAAIANTSGEFLQISKSIKSVLGCDEQRLLSGNETVFSIGPSGQKSELFKAYSNALSAGSAYRVLQHITCSRNEAMPVITHFKKVCGEGNEEMVLCLNIRA